MPVLPYNADNVKFAKALRKNMTPEERKLWFCFLRKHIPKFVRQKPIDNYIVDFYCQARKIAVEIDGSQHYDIKGVDYDTKRTDILNDYGIKVIRFSNREINQQFKEVCTVIEQCLHE